MVSVLVLVTTSGASAESAPLSDAQLNSVLANCSIAQVTLGRVQQSDKPARINRGFRYDSLLKLMVKLNTRAAQNRLDSPDLFKIIIDYENEIKEFTNTYTVYDDALSYIQNMNCKEKPTDFYDLLTTIRDNRVLLQEIVGRIDAHLDAYQANAKALSDSILAEERGSADVQ